MDHYCLKKDYEMKNYTKFIRFLGILLFTIGTVNCSAPPVVIVETPSQPKINNTSAYSNDAIRITFLPSTDNATKQADLTYRIYYSEAPNVELESINLVDTISGSDPLEVIIDGLNADTEYYIRIQVEDGDGNQSVSAEIPQKTLEREIFFRDDIDIYGLDEFSINRVVQNGDNFVMDLNSNSTLPAVGAYITGTYQTMPVFGKVTSITPNGNLKSLAITYESVFNIIDSGVIDLSIYPVGKTTDETQVEPETVNNELADPISNPCPQRLGKIIFDSVINFDPRIHVNIPVIGYESCSADPIYCQSVKDEAFVKVTSQLDATFTTTINLLSNQECIDKLYKIDEASGIISLFDKKQVRQKRTSKKFVPTIGVFAKLETNVHVTGRGTGAVRVVDTFEIKSNEFSMGVSESQGRFATPIVWTTKMTPLGVLAAGLHYEIDLIPKVSVEIDVKAASLAFDASLSSKVIGDVAAQAENNFFKTQFSQYDASHSYSCLGSFSAGLGIFSVP